MSAPQSPAEPTLKTILQDARTDVQSRTAWEQEGPRQEFTHQQTTDCVMDFGGYSMGSYRGHFYPSSAQSVPDAAKVARQIANCVIAPLLKAANSEKRISLNFLDEVAIETTAILRPYFSQISDVRSADREWLKKKADREDKHIVAAGLAWEATQGPLSIMWPKSVPFSEFSLDFVQYMANRMATSFYVYGAISNAYPHKVNAIESLKQRITEYLKSGNTEFLVDAANFCLIEFLLPSKAGAEFKATDSTASPGRIRNEGTITTAKNSDITNAPSSAPESTAPPLPDAIATNLDYQPTPVHMPPRGVIAGTHKEMEEITLCQSSGDGQSAGQTVTSEPLQPAITRSGNELLDVIAINLDYQFRMAIIEGRDGEFTLQLIKNALGDYDAIKGSTSE